MVAHKLSNLQLELLKIFQFNIPEKQLLEIKQLLVDYFFKKITHDFDELWDQNGWTEETMHQWANEHLRTPAERPFNIPPHEGRS